MRKDIFFRRLCNPEPMTVEEKVRYGMMAVGATSLVFATLGLHVSPFDPMSGAGS